MNEEKKTIVFLAVALVCGIVAYGVSREADEKTAEDEIGNSFVEIENALDVTRLKIVKFDADEGSANTFEVAKVDGLFSIPSHENYPADERDHLVDAVTGVNDVKILASVTNKDEEHRIYGVRDPSTVSKGEKAEAVGTRITLSDSNQEPLADFIVGREVKDAEGQYYVRHAGNAHVYTVEIKPDEMSTRFEDWIERDLLKFDPLKLANVEINDYSVATQKQTILSAGGLRTINVVRGLEMKSLIEARYDQEDLKWELVKLIEFENGNPVEEKLAEDEELNKTSLEDLKAALDDLKIVDVHRKAKGLGGSLEEFVKTNPKAVENLDQHGFFFRKLKAPDGSERDVLLSNNGEITVGMDDGVKYVLRFGNVAGADKDEKESVGDATAATDKGADEKKKTSKVLRNLLVMAEFNEDLIEQPDYEEVPPAQPPAEPAEDPAEKQDADKPAADGESAAGEPTAPIGDGEGDGEGAGDAAGEGAGEEEAASCCDDDDDAAEETEETEETDAVDTETGETERGETAAGETAAGETDAGETAASETTAEDAEKKLEEWKQKRDQIIKANDRKKQDYEAKIKAGRERVEELNRRFSAWYYVISDETYQKIHLTRKDVVKKKEKTDEKKDGPDSAEKDAFQQLNDLKNVLPPCKFPGAGE